MTVTRYYQARLSNQHGFSLFEIVVVILLIGVLVSAAIDRLLQLQIETERISVKHVIGVLESAVYMQTAEIVLRQGLGSLREMENTNPVDYLEKPPDNYAGKKSGAAAEGVPVSNWYFDSVKHVLVYKVKNIKYFESDIQGEPRIQLKLFLIYRDGIKSDRNTNIQGVKLSSLYKYNWKRIDE